jgi:signal transduction histidine kinase
VTVNRRGLHGPVAARLALVFLAVAVGSILLLSILLLLAASRDVAHLSRQQQDDTVAEVARAAAVANNQAGGWTGADLDAAITIGADAGGRVAIIDQTGRPVTPPPARRPSGRSVTKDVMANGRPVGTVEVTFPNSQLTTPQRHLRDALIATVAAGAGLAAVLALAAAVAVSRRITQPLVTLTAAAQAVGHGDRTARVGEIPAPGEFRELAVAFDSMADSLAQQDAARRALVADVAHELRTPLTILRGTLEGMADGVVTTTPAQLLSTRDDVLRLQRIVEDLETLAAADAAGLGLETAPVDLASIAAGNATALKQQFLAAEVSLETKLEPAMVTGDSARLHQVVANLLTNALKFTPAGGRVEVSVHPEGDQAVLEVTDTGIGIPEEEVPRVFDRFWRGAQAQSVAGSGIGLTVVAELVQAHGGTTAVESESGRGSRFSVTLPLA